MEDLGGGVEEEGLEGPHEAPERQTVEPQVEQPLRIEQGEQGEEGEETLIRDEGGALSEESSELEQWNAELAKRYRQIDIFVAFASERSKQGGKS